MRALVIGGSGMLGSDLVAELTGRAHEAILPTHADLDITDPISVADLPQLAEGVTWCVNCAAYTAVDRAETEREQACLLNSIAPGYLASACVLSGMRLLHVSTDFVFDGEAHTPYEEDSMTNPVGYYGESKRDGEEAVLQNAPDAAVVRTSWLFGPNGNSFPRTMIRAWEAGKSLRVISDQIGCPTYTGDLARTLVDVIEANLSGGVYHAVGSEAMSWYDFALRTLDAWEAKKASPKVVAIEPIPTEAYPTPAKRPKYSVLSTAKLQAAGIGPMRPLDESVSDFVDRGLRLPDWP